MSTKKKYTHLEIEAKWRKKWDQWSLYSFCNENKESFTIDTPPPTVSGELHIGHTFSFTHQDIIARFQRKRGKNIYYPMGWDDNGLPTERRAQRLLGISCAPMLPDEGPYCGQNGKLPRNTFISACQQVTEKDEAKYQELWRSMGLSVDWSLLYSTIDPFSRKSAQKSFLQLLQSGRAYQAEGPTMWDIDFQTAVAQAETETRPKSGLLHHIEFSIEGGGEMQIATTRPEMLAACFALAANPADERYKGLFGKYAITPLFGAKIPILPSEHACPEMGTGCLMICSFGDSADVAFWKESGLPARPIIGHDGRLLAINWGAKPFECADAQLAQDNYDKLAGLTIEEARKAIASLLGEALLSKPTPIEQQTNFYEKGDRPLEFLTTRQWFIDILSLKDKLLELGRQIEWQPEHFRKRYEHWVEGLNQDWCISRQRFYGVPIPLWYPINSQGEIDYGNPILPTADSLPIDPMSQCPKGYREDMRNKINGFTASPDVLDTWATSSLTPLIASRWADEKDANTSLLPMDLRPQGQEIIRTWTFYTIVMTWLHKKTIPWRKILISGWVTSPDKEKMSKSKGNTITPEKLIEKYSADAVRYWAAKGKPGTDKSFEEESLKIGRRLALKIFNAGKFLQGCLDKGAEMELALASALDKSYLCYLAKQLEITTEAYKAMEYSKALETAEESFWTFCNDYLELAKTRAYEGSCLKERASALYTLQEALRIHLAMLSPIMPYITEEIWSWFFSHEGQERSIHTASWPRLTQSESTGETSFLAAARILTATRKAKTEQKRSLRWPITNLKIKASEKELKAIEPILADLAAAAAVEQENISLTIGEDWEIEPLLKDE